MNKMHQSESFRLYLIRKGLKPASVNRTIELVFRYLKHHDINDVDSYLLKLTESHKHSYLNSIIASLRNYGHFTKNKRLQNIQFFKQQESEKAILSDEEIEELLALPPPENLNKTGRESYSKMTMFWQCVAFTGARCGEIANLDINHVDFGRNILMVDGKTGRRNIPISSALDEPLKAHISKLNGQLLFQSSRTKKPIDRATWHWEFQERIKRMGIKRDRLTPHSLRHSFITRLLNEDVNIFRVQKVVGHRNIQTTEKYTHLTTKDLIETIKKDPLSRQSLPFYDRLKAFRDEARLLLASYALSPAEEKEMLENL